MLKDPELADKQCQEITQKLAEIDALCQNYARKCTIKVANAALENDIQKTQKKKKIIDKKNENKLPKFLNLKNLIKKKRDTSLTSTVNDASSLSSRDSGEINDSNDSENAENFLKVIADCQTDFKTAQSYLNFDQFPIKSLDDWQNRLKVILF